MYKPEKLKALWWPDDSGNEYWPANKVARTCCARYGKLRLRVPQMIECWDDCQHVHANGEALPYPRERVNVVA